MHSTIKATTNGVKGGGDGDGTATRDGWHDTDAVQRLAELVSALLGRSPVYAASHTFAGVSESHSKADFDRFLAHSALQEAWLPPCERHRPAQPRASFTVAHARRDSRALLVLRG